MFPVTHVRSSSSHRSYGIPALSDQLEFLAGWLQIIHAFLETQRATYSGYKAQYKGIPETMVCRILMFMWVVFGILL